jgi:hypothetical protein
MICLRDAIAFVSNPQETIDRCSCPATIVPSYKIPIALPLFSTAIAPSHHNPIASFLKIAIALPPNRDRPQQPQPRSLPLFPNRDRIEPCTRLPLFKSDRPCPQKTDRLLSRTRSHLPQFSQERLLLAVKLRSHFSATLTVALQDRSP